jgi:hypothetical protein
MTFAMVGSGCAPGILDGRAAAVPSAVSSNSSETDFLRIFARQGLALGTRPDFHHVPGRLRLRAEGLKRDPAKLEAIRSEFAAVPGVRSATTNRLTGSVIVDYDPLVLAPDTLSAALREYRSGTEQDGLPSWGEHINAKLIEWLLEKLAVALIAAMV